jgi:hypothetical protein
MSREEGPKLVCRPQKPVLLQKVDHLPGHQLMGTAQNIGTDIIPLSMSILMLEGGFISISMEADGRCQLASLALSGLDLPITWSLNWKLTSPTNTSLNTRNNIRPDRPRKPRRINDINGSESFSQFPKEMIRIFDPQNLLP